MVNTNMRNHSNNRYAYDIPSTEKNNAKFDDWEFELSGTYDNKSLHKECLECGRRYKVVGDAEAIHLDKKHGGELYVSVLAYDTWREIKVKRECENCNNVMDRLEKAAMQEDEQEDMQENTMEDDEDETTTDLAVPTDGLESVMEVDLDEDFDDKLGRFLMEREYYHDAVKNEPPKLTAEISDTNMRENRQNPIWVRFKTDTGRTIDNFYEKPNMTDTFETNTFLKILKITGVSAYNPDELVGKEVPLIVDEEEEFFEPLIETDEERLDRLHEEAKEEHDIGVPQEEQKPPLLARGMMAMYGIAKFIDGTIQKYENTAAVTYGISLLTVILASIMSIPFPAYIPIGGFPAVALIIVMIVVGTFLSERY